ncbi:hypothetical protein QA641_36475 [Bradyrhizobium sp. CB1650]|uniref:hypothetical protein n=1 Tax=Bradyrhizobium sp. CB1650 TaxID=3039153 RepID=UPI00243556A9|nr:hypothetical protein [Bradyrhizobium sp. CB1650]WGD51014.1 hypothetical protein QA641_36475 [Bradyrhizobium sp. CB1650]
MLKGDVLSERMSVIAHSIQAGDFSVPADVENVTICNLSPSAQILYPSIAKFSRHSASLRPAFDDAADAHDVAYCSGMMSPGSPNSVEACEGD